MLLHSGWFFLSPFDSFVIVVLLARGGSVLTTKVIYSKYYKNYNNEFHGFKPILTQTIHFEAKIEKNLFSVKVNLPKNKKSVRFSWVRFIVLGIYDFTHHQPRLLSFVHDELFIRQIQKSCLLASKKMSWLWSFDIVSLDESVWCSSDKWQ